MDIYSTTTTQLEDPDYNTTEDRAISRRQLEEMGFNDIEEFNYKTHTSWNEERKSARC